MRQRTTRHQSGFTLVETLVVITILGVISVGAVVAFGGFSKATDDATCAADEKSLASAQDAALATNGVYLTETELVAEKFLKEDIGSFDVVLASGAKSYSLVMTGTCTLAVASSAPPTSSTAPTSTTPTSTTTTSTTTTTTTTAAPDTTPPAVTITSCSVASSGAKRWSAAGTRGTAPGDLAGVTVTITPGNSSQSSSSAGVAWSVGPSQNPLSKGSYTCTARQTDTAGNVGTASRALVVA